MHTRVGDKLLIKYRPLNQIKEWWFLLYKKATFRAALIH